MLDLKAILNNPGSFLASMNRRGYPGAQETLRVLVHLNQQRKALLAQISEIENQEKQVQAELRGLLAKEEKDNK